MCIHPFPFIQAVAVADLKNIVDIVDVANIVDITDIMDIINITDIANIERFEKATSDVPTTA